MISLKQLISQQIPDFFNNLDPNFRVFAREIKKELREEGHVVIGLTGYPGTGKSNMAAILGCLIDEDYNFEFNVCYIPTSKNIEEGYMKLKMYSYLHIDEASRGLHKHKWYDRVQQKLNELYDVEREGHFLCTALIMPRFQNFTENFRNFMIKYWINIPIKGLAVFYKRDEDKDTKDPWHLDESYKKKKDRWHNKRVFERSLPDVIRAEQLTDCYWFYCKVPAIPDNIWIIYQDLKKNSRVNREPETDVESYKEKVDRERIEKWGKIRGLKQEGKTHEEIGAILGVSSETIRRYLRQMEAYDRMKGGAETPHTNVHNNIYNQLE